LATVGRKKKKQSTREKKKGSGGDVWSLQTGVKREVILRAALITGGVSWGPGAKESGCGSSLDPESLIQSENAANIALRGTKTKRKNKRKKKTRRNHPNRPLIFRIEGRSSWEAPAGKSRVKKKRIQLPKNAPEHAPDKRSVKSFINGRDETRSREKMENVQGEEPGRSGSLRSSEEVRDAKKKHPMFASLQEERY